MQSLSIHNMQKWRKKNERKIKEEEEKRRIFEGKSVELEERSRENAKNVSN